MNIHIITPFHRLENKGYYENHLGNLGVIWHPISDILDIEFKAVDWIQPLFAIPTKGWDECYWKLNFFLDNSEIIDDDYYSFLMDDDSYEEGERIFNTVRQSSNKVIMVSMKRGLYHPVGWDTLPLMSRHGNSTLLANSKNTRVGCCGCMQIFVLGSELKKYRFVNKHVADGIFVEQLANNYNIEFIPELYVLFNYLEKGRY